MTGRGAARQVGAQAGRKRSRGGHDGVGATHPVARSLFSGTLEDAPRGENLDVPMTPKRLKVFKPSTSRHLECGGTEPSRPASRASTSRPIARSRGRLSLEEANTEALSLNVGSDNENDDDDSGDEVWGEVRSRVLRLESAREEEEEEAEALPEGEIVAKQPEQAAGPTDLFDFDWRILSDVAFNPMERREKFEKHRGSIEHHESPYDAFTAIWDHDIMERIVRETNLYAQQVTEDLITTGRLGLKSRMIEWTDTTVDELYVWMAITQAMGVVLKGTDVSYWSTNDDVFDTPGYKHHMSLRRFQLLNRCIHFNDNRSGDLRTLPISEARVFKVKPIIDHLNQKFMNMYQMGQNIALDESLTQWKGALSMKQSVRTKAAQVGIKTFEVCETHTGYLYCFDVYTGAVPPTPGVPVQNLGPVESTIPALVLNLLNDLKLQGHTVWMDNFYNSPALARTMKSMGFDCVGTLRTNRRHVPEQLTHLTKDNMRRGEMKAVTSGDIDIVVYKDQNRVALISTYHGDGVKVSGGRLKPIVVLDYNINMGGVDKKDQMLAAYPIERKRTRVWYKKFFKRLLNVSILNSFVLWKHSPRGLRRDLDHRSFRIALVNALLKKHSTSTEQHTGSAAQPSAKFSDFVMDHFPVATNLGPSGKKNRLICAVCKKRAVTMCHVCKVGLCSGGTYPTCAQSYHTRRTQ